LPRLTHAKQIGDAAVAIEPVASAVAEPERTGSLAGMPNLFIIAGPNGAGKTT
jgi:signal recognition particle GTPase